MLGQYRKRVPFVFQIQQTECGLCCVCMISHYYKNYVSMEELREQLEIGRDGANMLQLVDLLKHYKFQTKAYKVDAGHIDLIPTPAIVLWDNELYVVLQKVSKDICIIVDPSIGTVRIGVSNFLVLAILLILFAIS